MEVNLATKEDIDSLRRMIEQLIQNREEPQTIKPRAYSRKEAMKILGISEVKFKKLEQLGVVRGGDYLPNTMSGKMLYKASSIERLLKELPD